MAKQKKGKYANISTFKKACVITGHFIFLLGGVGAFVVAVDHYKNYFHPYLFTFSFGMIGLGAGLFIAKKIKPYIILNKTMLSNYDLLTIQFSLSLIGGFVLLGYLINANISTKIKCGRFTVIDTKHIEGHYRQPEYNILYVDIDGRIESMLVEPEDWKAATIGHQVNICIYHSPIGFDNMVLQH